MHPKLRAVWGKQGCKKCIYYKQTQKNTHIYVVERETFDCVAAAWSAERV